MVKQKYGKAKNKLLGVIIDRQLNFDEYFISLCKKARKKLSILARLANFLSLEQRKLLMKSFIESQFGSCPLTCMFCGRKTNTRINHVHERALRIVYKNNSLCFDWLLQIDKSYNIHHKNSDVNIHIDLVSKFLALKNRWGEHLNSRDIAPTTHSVSSYWSILALS